jgi:hypothetical protein
LRHRPELPDHEEVPRQKMMRRLCSRTRESRRGIGRERVKRRPGTRTRRIDSTCSVADIDKLSSTVFSFRRGLNYARGCGFRASSAITMTLERFRKFRYIRHQPQDRQNARAGNSCDAEGIDHLRKQERNPAQAQRQPLDEVRRQAVATLAASPARSCPLARNGNRRVPSSRERLETNSAR